VIPLLELQQPQGAPLQQHLHLITVELTPRPPSVQLYGLKVSTREQCVVEAQLSRSTLEHLTLVRVLRYQAVDSHLLLLTDTVSTSGGLYVILGVPITVVYYHYLSCSEVYALSSSLGTQQKDLPPPFGIIEPIYSILPVIALDVSCEFLILDSTCREVVFQESKHLREL
jgi:hypothetical protein